MARHALDWRWTLAAAGGGRYYGRRLALRPPEYGREWTPYLSESAGDWTLGRTDELLGTAAKRNSYRPSFGRWDGRKALGIGRRGVPKSPGNGRQTELVSVAIRMLGPSEEDPDWALALGAQRDRNALAWALAKLQVANRPSFVNFGFRGRFSDFPV